MKEFKIKINGNDYNVAVGETQEDNKLQISVNGTHYEVETETPVSAAPVIKPIAGSVSKPASPVASAPAKASSGSSSAIKSPLPGVILDMNVKVGDTVTTGQKLLVLEAMKMENVISSDKDGKVTEVKVNKGDSVLEGDDLVVIA